MNQIRSTKKEKTVAKQLAMLKWQHRKKEGDRMLALYSISSFSTKTGEQLHGFPPLHFSFSSLRSNEEQHTREIGEIGEGTEGREEEERGFENVIVPFRHLMIVIIINTFLLLCFLNLFLPFVSC